MSESIKRRSSSRQLLQNLIRVTAQRSQEDAEEVERERRRRARERQRGEESPSWPVPNSDDDLTINIELDTELKPCCSLVLDEDEGFSDWSHRLENRNEQEVQNICRAGKLSLQDPQWKPGPVEEKQQGKEEWQQPEGSIRSQENSSRTMETVPGPRDVLYLDSDKQMSGKEKEIKSLQTSSVAQLHDTRLQHSSGRPADSRSYLVAETMGPCAWSCRVDEEVQQEDLKEVVEKLQLTLQTDWSTDSLKKPNSNNSPEEELLFTHEQRKEHLLRVQQRHMDEEREELEAKRGEEEGHKTSEKELRGSTERKSEEVNRGSGVSPCSVESPESLNCYGPMSPTFKKLLVQFYPDEINSKVSTDGKCKIIERTESLRRSTNTNIKKTPSPVTVSKIDKKLEQYTHAIELCSKEARLGGQVLTDMMSPTEPIASKKNLFEVGDAWNQNMGPVTASKQDADGIKVGVSDLINQWMKGGEDGNTCISPSKPAEIKPGGVLNKKNLWESFGDIISPGTNEKEISLGKKYKFVVTGHGKYEKVDDSSSEATNCGSDFFEDL
ncbi:lymphocyte-specific protein 1-like [Cynoglossus semilaevis]|uniref:lymphocyte-specific protein 1-like n=1 Tax=Cynoglossus semilaevis TaxID=244447 RepID=UPI00049835F9|nr:lymphocyte-specific protein 1-like [Cynoglossus semilaevis]